MYKLYFSYSLMPHQSLDGAEPRSAPYSITWNMGRFLRDRAQECGYTFEYVNLDSVEPQSFDASDIVIGHLWHTPNSFIRQALGSSAKTFILQPYSHRMVSEGDVPEYLGLFQKAVHLFFITGEYWYNTMLESPFAALYPNVTRVDMAVNPAQHPFSKTTWNPPGKRGFLCIGADIPVKGLANVAELARIAGFRLGHYGSANPETFRHVPQMTLHGGKDFTPDVIADICKDYDYFLSLASSDANPTSLLETAAWGLIGACTRESGYLNHKPFIPLKLDDLEFNLSVIDGLQSTSESALHDLSLKMRTIVEEQYAWVKFTATVWARLCEWVR
jgi:hypothetical protein